MRNQVNYNKPVGIVDGVLYLVNYTFEDTLHGEPFKGVTASVLEPVTQAQLDEYNDLENAVEYYQDIWKACVQAGTTELGLEDFAEECMDDQDSIYPGHDDSSIGYVPDDVKEKYFPDAVTFNCIGGGRSFKGGMKWDVILDQHLVDEINRLEKQEA